MRRAFKWAAWIVGLLIGIPVLLVVALLAFGNLGFGRSAIASLIGRATGGTVTAEGLSGTFPTDLTLRHVALRDRDGLYAVIEELSLSWSPLRLVSGEAAIDRLTAEGVHVFRLPVSSAPANGTSSGSSSLPVKVALDHLHVNRLELDEPVLGTQLVASVDGNAHLASYSQGDVDVTLREFGGPGVYALKGSFDAAHIDAALDVHEGAQGPVARLARLPDLGALSLTASLKGPKSAEATQLAVTAGKLKAQAHGTLDLANDAADLDVTASAPAMAPRPDASWRDVSLDAHVHGPFTKPDASGHLRIDGLAAGGATIASLTADVQGNAGHVALTADLDGLRVPGPKPDIMAGAPLTLTAEATLDDPKRPIRFTLHHPLIEAKGHADTGTAIDATMDLSLPELAPFAAVAGVDLQGHTEVTVQAREQKSDTVVAVNGTVGVTGGLAPVPALIGPDATIGVAATLSGQDITVQHVDVGGRTLRVHAQGADRGGALDLTYDVALTDLAALSSGVSGDMTATGRVQGTQTDLAVDADLKGELAAGSLPRGPIEAHLHAAGLPRAPSGTLTAQGTLGGSPLQLAASVRRDADGAMQARITQADWKSAHVEGDFTLPAGATLPLGQARLRMGRLADLRPFLGQDIGGSLNATVDLAADALDAKLEASDAGLPGERIGRATLTAHVADPTTAPVVDAHLAADGIDAKGVGGSARVDATGPENAVGVRLSAALTNVSGADARVAGAAVVDAKASSVALNTLTVDWRDEPIRLLAPAHVSYGGGISVDRLRLGIRQAVAELAGRISPTLDLSASLRNVTPDLAKPFMPTLDAAGTIEAQARLTGTTARPTGTIRVSANGMRLLTGPARSLPPANLTATADLAGTTAKLDAHLTAGTTRLAVAGTAPIAAGGALDLHATGSVNLAITDPVLTPSGRRVRGVVTLDATVAGTEAAPQIHGTVRLANGEVQDYAQGAHITDLTALIEADGDTIRIASLTGRAGPGTIGASGTVGLRAPMPVDLRLTMRDARPLASDLLTATLDADLALRGQVQGQLDASGSIHVRRADITVPDKLPTSVAVLNVMQPGQKPPPPSAPALTVGLNLTVEAPRAIFVRGHGLNAELGGRLRVAGTSAKPEIGGGFTLRQGQFSLAGTTLTFTTGRVTFDGTGVENKIDPALYFEADSTSGGITAQLKVTGYADAPKISLTSNPPLPQDEILARLLFGRSVKDLGPLQYAQIAQALVEISGVGGGGGNPLNAIRKGLGLDRLNVTQGANGAGPSVEGGSYVANGVYVGAKQATEGQGTQAQVQIDLWKGLKLDTGVGAGRGANSVGLSYQFQY